MASDVQKHVQSLFIPPPHPVLHRERSYSLPPGLALMSAEEATMIFSAAEKATSRRRRMASVGPSFAVGRRPILDSGSNSSLPSPEEGPLTPPNASTNQANPAEKDHVAVEDADHQMNFSWGTDATKADLQPTEPFPALPLFSTSPTSPRRLVGSPMEKSYADGLYEYTRSRLTTVTPRFRIDSVSSDNHLDHDQASTKHDSRPALTSHFSDWSITTGDKLSRQGSRLAIPSPFEDDADPLFDFDFLAPEPSIEFGPGPALYARSEALVSSSTLPPPTPPSYPRPGDDEISYFSNFEYLHESPKQPQRPSRKTKHATFTLSPMPSPADTTIGDACEPDEMASVGTSGGAVQDVGEESVGLQTARLAVRVPNELIGTV
jgi:hypothetical protein